WTPNEEESLTDYRSNKDKKTKFNTLKEFCRIITLISETTEETVKAFEKLEMIALKANYPLKVIKQLMKECLKEDGMRENMLWDIDWEEFKKVVEREWKVQLQYLKRKH